MSTSEIRPIKQRRTWPRALLLALVALLACAVHAVFTASATAPLGPHFATYELTTSGRLVIDLGPLGNIEREAGLPGPIGIQATVHEIPDDFAASPDDDDVDGLMGDLQQYVAFFSSPDDTVRMVQDALGQAIARQMLRDVGIVAISLAVIALLVGRRRGQAVSRVALRAAPWVALVAVLAGTAGAVVVDGRVSPVAGASVLEGTPLAGTHVTGRLGGVLETYGKNLVDIYRDNQDFYATARTNLAAAWQERVATDPEYLTQTTPITQRSAESLADPSVPLLAQALPLGDASDWVTMVVVADLHCNFSMSPLVGELVKESQAKILLHAGDATIDGAAVEEICPSSLAAAVPDGTDIVYAGGNHDSETTADQFADQGATVLRGKTESIAGVTILGDLDPFKTRIGQGTSLAREESFDELAQRLSESACADEPDILLIHSPYIAENVNPSGCTHYSISGHLHRRIGPEANGGAIAYVNASSAGAVEGQLTLGPLHGTAEMTVLRFDPETRAMVDYRIVSVFPDASVKVSSLAGYPLPSSLVTAYLAEHGGVDPVVTPPAPTDATTDTPAGTDPATPSQTPVVTPSAPTDAQVDAPTDADPTPQPAG